MNWINPFKYWWWNAICLLAYCLIACSLIILLWSPLCNVIDNALIPLFSQLENNQILIAMAISVCVFAIFFLTWKSRIRERWFSDRKIIIILFLVAGFFFRIYDALTDDEYYFTGLFNGRIAYWNIFLFEVIIGELLSRHYKIKELFKSRKNNIENISAITTPFLPDIPTENDKYARNHHAELLVEKIIVTAKNLKGEKRNGSFNILLSECYGYGKTSFLQIVEKNCKKRGVQYFTFRPWLCENPELVIRNYFNLLKEQFVGDRHLEKLFQLYTEIITTGVSNKVAKAILTFSKEESLETLHDKISEALKSRERPIVVSIDDVDRLQYKELVSLIKLIRNTADFPNVFYIIAADKNALSQMLHDEGKIKNPEIYLQKFFNYELMFPASESYVISEILQEGLKKVLSQYPNFNISNIRFDSLLKNDSIQLDDIFNHPRDAYRYLNMLSFEIDNLNKELILRHPDAESVGDNDICLIELLKILVVRLLMPEIYKIFRDNKDKYFLDLRSDGRLVLAEKYSDFYKRQFSRRYDGRNIKNETIFDLPRRNFDQQNVINNDTTTSFNEIIAENRPSKEDIVKGIMIDLWSSIDVVDSVRPSITKHEEFFRYFSGRWESNKVSIYEVKKNMMLPVNDYLESCKVFKEWLDGVVARNQIKSIINKTKDLVNGPISIENHFDLILNIFTCIRKQFDTEGKTTNVTIKDCYNNWEKTIRRLLQKDKDLPNVFYTRFTLFFSQSKEFEICALFLQSIQTHLYYYKEQPQKIIPCIFDIKQYQEMSKKLIDRFFSEEVSNRPYDLYTINIHAFCKIANVRYWKEQLHNYLQNQENPLIWLYGTFYWFKDQQKFYWNDNVVYALYDSIDPNREIESIFGDLLPDNYKNDLKKIPSPEENRGYGFDGTDIQLLTDVKEWQEKGHHPFPKPEWIK